MSETAHDTPADISPDSSSGADLNVGAGLTARQQAIRQIHDVWNYWIIYPFGAWVPITAAFGWSVYGTKPISEAEIKREIERQAGWRQ